MASRNQNRRTALIPTPPVVTETPPAPTTEVATPEKIVDDLGVERVRSESGIMIPQPIRRVGRSGNIPWRRKFYTLDREVFDAAVKDKSIGKLPNQAQRTLFWMRDNMEPGIAHSGPIIQERAITEGYVASRIAPASLFAYYRKKMEEFGLTHVDGYTAPPESDESGDEGEE